MRGIGSVLVMVVCLVLFGRLYAEPAAQSQTAPATLPANFGPWSAAVPEFTWQDMQKYFVPPPEYAGKLGTYRDVLKFDDGTPVKTPQDWAKRRQEILDYWHGAIGKWPAPIEKPKVIVNKTEHVDHFTRIEVQIEVTPTQQPTGPQFILVPDGKGPFPAVVVTWYGTLDTAGKVYPDPKMCPGPIDFGRRLANRGYVVLCLGNCVIPTKGVQPLSYTAYAVANCYNVLANMKEVDPKRVGVMGFSLGGIIAMFGSCLCDKFACAVWIDPAPVIDEKRDAAYNNDAFLGWDFSATAHPGGLPISDKNPRRGAYAKLVVEKHNFNELHALMAPRPLLVSAGQYVRPEDWTAFNHLVAVNNLLGYKDRVAVTWRNQHYPTLESLGQIYAFLDHFLKGEQK